MKKLSIIFFAVLAIISISACNNDDDEPTVVCDECSGKGSEEKYMVVNGEPYPCDAETGYCMLVKLGNIVTTQSYYNPYSYNNYQTSYELEDDEWQNFEDTICGFNYEPGYEYEIIVTRIKDDSEDEYKYCLNEVLSQTKIFL